MGGLDLEDPVADLEHRHVEGAAPEVEDQDCLVLIVLVETVGKCSCSGLVDNSENLKAGDLSRLLCRSALGVVEVGRNGDYGLVDSGPEIRLGVPLQLLEDAGRDLLSRVVLAVNGLGPA